MEHTFSGKNEPRNLKWAISFSIEPEGCNFLFKHGITSMIFETSGIEMKRGNSCQ